MRQMISGVVAALAVIAAGVAPASGSRVKKAMLALRSLAQSANQPSGIVMARSLRTVCLGHA